MQNEYVTVRRLKDSQQFSIHKKYLEDTLKQGFALVPEAPPSADDNSVKTEEKIMFECPICGKQFEKKRALTMHRTKAHV